MSRAAVVGLGSMGFGMAQALLRAGVETFGYDVRADAAARFAAEGGAPGALLDVAASLDALVLVVLNAEQAEAALFGPEGVAAHLRAGAVVIACPTMPPAAAAALAARVEALRLHYLDAPISGGAVKAAEGKLSIMASGSEAAFAAAAPFLEAMAASVHRLGDHAGPASAMKAVNQLLAGVHIAAMGEAMAFGQAHGLAPARVLEVIAASAGASFMFANRGQHVVDGDYTPRSAVNIWLKDLGIVLDMARRAPTPTPLAAAALQQFVAASAAGLGLEDDAAVFKIYARRAE